jgi:flagellar motor protein MotB
MNSGRAPAWALSFADLCLLLLGFFIMLHALTGQKRQLVEGMHKAFGGVALPAPQDIDINPRQLFEPGEAVLLAAAREKLIAIGHRAAAQHAHVRIASVGTDPATNRFDGWELAAARTAAVARGIAASGLPDSAIEISIPAMAGSTPDSRQHIAIEIVSAK